MANPDLQIRGGGGHPDPEITGEGRGIKKNFPALRTSVWSKNKGGPGPPPPDLPLNVYGIQLIEKQVLPF